MPNESQAPGTDRLDRAAVMIEARRQYQIMGPLGWTFAKCLAYSWNKAKRQAAQTPQAQRIGHLRRGPPSEGDGAMRAISRFMYTPNIACCRRGESQCYSHAHRT